jgi:prepilin-type processing-associated H-X9-DG protein
MSDPISAPPKRKNFMAIVSLACGVFCIIPTAAVLSLIFGIVGVFKARDPKVGGKSMSIFGIVLGVIGLTVFPFLVRPSLSKSRETANRVGCANYLQQMGLAISLYADDHNGAFPPDLGTLVKTEDIAASVFVCPSTGKEPPSNLTKDQAVSWVNANSDYIYLGAGLKSGVDAETVIVYEKDENHGGQGMNVLYSDCHVEFLALAGAHAEIEASKTAISARLKPRGK